MYLPLVMHVDSPPEHSTEMLLTVWNIPVRRVDVKTSLLCQTNKLHTLTSHTYHFLRKRGIKNILPDLSEPNPLDDLARVLAWAGAAYIAR